MRQYELHSPHLINVATLPCESPITENVTLQWDMTEENCIRCITASSKWTRVIMCLKFTYVGVIQQSMHETRMWANAQRDGYRWRPLLNATKFG